MSRVAYIGSVNSPHASFPGDPGEPRYALFPGHSEASLIETGVPLSKFPKRFDFTTIMEAWWRGKRFQADFHFVWSGSTEDGVPSMSFTATPAPDENSRCGLDYFRWRGEYDVSTGGQTRTIEFILTIFRDELDSSLVPAYYWRPDTTPPSIVPRMEIKANGDLDYGTEMVFNASTSEPPASPGPNYFEDNLTFMGQVLRFWCDPTEPVTAFSMDLSIAEWWEYRDSNGVNPIWNSATGAQLLQQTPIYAGNAPV